MVGKGGIEMNKMKTGNPKDERVFKILQHQFELNTPEYEEINTRFRKELQQTYKKSLIIKWGLSKTHPIPAK